MIYLPYHGDMHSIDIAFQGTDLYALISNTYQMGQELYNKHETAEDFITFSYFFEFLQNPEFSEDFNVSQF